MDFLETNKFHLKSRFCEQYKIHDKNLSLTSKQDNLACHSNMENCFGYPKYRAPLGHNLNSFLTKHTNLENLLSLQ